MPPTNDIPRTEPDRVLAEVNTLKIMCAKLEQQLQQLRGGGGDDMGCFSGNRFQLPPELGAGGDSLTLPFAYFGPDPASAPDNNVALLRVGWVEVTTPADKAAIGTPAAGDDLTTDADVADDTTKTEPVTLLEGDNFICAHFARNATVADSTLELVRFDSWADIPTNTNDDYYYPLALVTLTSTTDEDITTGVQRLVRPFRAGNIAWIPTPKTLNYCDGGISHAYDIPAYEAPPPE
jgi:hypothetical protein